MTTSEHRIIQNTGDTIYCSCGTKCREGIDTTPIETWQMHADSFKKAKQ